jgi:DNA-binding transcriptional ArsR family regulator
MGMYSGAMARAATTSDAFNAIAEPQRRAILTLLKGRERPVGDLARALRMTQPRASKHLRVLREVGLVRVRGAGQQRLYSLDARGLKPIHEWVGGFEQFWNESLDRLNTYVQALRRQEQADDIGP